MAELPPCGLNRVVPGRPVSAAFNPNLSSGFVKLRAYARQIALRLAEGVVGYGEAERKDR